MKSFALRFASLCLPKWRFFRLPRCAFHLIRIVISALLFRDMVTWRPKTNVARIHRHRQKHQSGRVLLNNFVDISSLRIFCRPNKTQAKEREKEIDGETQMLSSHKAKESDSVVRTFFLAEKEWEKMSIDSVAFGLMHMFVKAPTQTS